MEVRTGEEEAAAKDKSTTKTGKGGGAEKNAAKGKKSATKMGKAGGLTLIAATKLMKKKEKAKEANPG